MLFLSAGGIILLLILLVVAFQMVRTPDKLVTEDVTPQRPKVEGVAERPAKPVRKVAKPLPSTKNEGLAPVFRSAAKAKKAAPAKPKPVAPTPQVKKVVPKPVKKAAKAPAPVTTKAAKAPVTVKKAAPAPVPVAKKAPPVKKAAAVVAKGFSVQLGSFSQRENADSVSRRVQTLKLPVFLQTVNVKGATYLRVRAGPFATRDEADKAARLVRTKAGISGTVVPYGK